MHHTLLPAARELDATARAVEDMYKSRELRVVEDAWKRVLDLLEKAWNKLELAATVSPSLKGAWLGGYVQFRREDALLRYLVHARNADNHSLTEVVRTAPGSMGIGLAPGASWGYVDELIISNGQIQQFTGADVAVTVKPFDIILLPVVDRGTTYPVPTEHCGFSFQNANPWTVATAGHSFYRFALSEAATRLAAPGAG